MTAEEIQSALYAAQIAREARLKERDRNWAANPHYYTQGMLDLERRAINLADKEIETLTAALRAARSFQP